MGKKEKETEEEAVDKYRKRIHEMIDEVSDREILIKIYTYIKYLK